VICFKYLKKSEKKENTKNILEGVSFAWAFGLETLREEDLLELNPNLPKFQYKLELKMRYDL